MSKSFEECYKTELLNELPDLWSRIEAGIKTGDKEVLPEESVTKAESEIIKEVPVSAAGNAQKSSTRWMVYVLPVMAACLLGVILLPIGMSLLVGNKSMDSAPAEMAGCDSAADEYVANDATDSNESYAPESVIQNDADAIASGERLEDAVSLPEREIIIEVVKVQDTFVTFYILDDYASEIAKEYELSEEDGMYLCECESTEGFSLMSGERYIACLSVDSGESVLKILEEYSE